MFVIMFFFYFKYFIDLSKSVVLILDIFFGNYKYIWEILIIDKNM